MYVCMFKVCSNNSLCHSYKWNNSKPCMRSFVSPDFQGRQNDLERSWKFCEGARHCFELQPPLCRFLCRSNLLMSILLITRILYLSKKPKVPHLRYCWGWHSWKSSRKTHLETCICLPFPLEPAWHLIPLVLRFLLLCIGLFHIMLSGLSCSRDGATLIFFRVSKYLNCRLQIVALGLRACIRAKDWIIKSYREGLSCRNCSNSIVAECQVYAVWQDWAWTTVWLMVWMLTWSS